VTHSTPGARAAKEATSTIPVVIAAVADPVALGLVASLARPGGNLTGLSFFWAEVAAKRIELIKETIPTLARVAVFVNPDLPASPLVLGAMQHAAGALGLDLVPITVRLRDDIAPAIMTAAKARDRALVVAEEPLLIANARQTADLALQNRLPMIGFRPHAEAGALMEYGVDLADLYRRSATFVDRILKGTPPADLPIERAVKFDLVVNLKTAKSLGLTVPPTLLARAAEVIE
jgi:putative ABC transport system substrate-binding protein